MKFRSLLFTAALLLTTLANAQNRVNYDSIADKTVDLSNSGSEKLLEIRQNLYSLAGHGVDSLDMDILINHNLLAQLMVELESGFTYSDLLQEIIKLKEEPGFQKVRNYVEIERKLEQCPGEYKYWSENKALLQQAGMDEKMIAAFEEYVKKNGNRFSNYKTLALDFSQEYNQNSPTKVNSDYVSVAEVEELISNTGAININKYLTQSKAEEKPVLLYFTGYAVMNAKRFEEKIFRYAAVYTQLKENYIFVPLYVDDSAELPEKEWFKDSKSERMYKTAGRKNLQYQMDKFNSNTQPFIAILNSKGELVDTAGYGMDEYQFLAFLLNNTYKN